MSRYKVSFVVFTLVTVAAAIWLFIEYIDYTTVGFDCDIPNLYGLACIEAAQRQIAHRMLVEGVVVTTVWFISMWVFIRGRKKR